ncbi:MAG: hypothetical protein Q4C47_01435 [Planctomycetia bacterium]|nr:hypothetical protein [Planctomycetia bacterium]
MECTAVNVVSRNMELRDAYEPYYDESFEWIGQANVSVEEENDYFEDMILWEEAPVLPIADWFSPPLRLADPRTMADDEVEDALISLRLRLLGKDVVLFNTGGLSPRYLYTLILRKILPMPEKFLRRRRSPIFMDCSLREDESI